MKSFNQPEQHKTSNDTFASSGTNIDEVKRKNAQSGLSYNQVKELLAKSYQDKKEQ